MTMANIWVIAIFFFFQILEIQNNFFDRRFFFLQILEKFKTTIDKTQEQTTPLDNVSINGKNPCNCNVFIFYKNSN